MDCLFLPYCNYFHSILQNWNHLSNNEKIEITKKLFSSLEYIKTIFKNDNIDHINYFYNCFQIKNNIVTLNIKQLYSAYMASKSCDLCSSCSNILLYFYSLCADILFDYKEIYEIDEEWLKLINNIPKEIKTKLISIDNTLLSHINIHRDTIIKQYVNKIKKNSNLNQENDFLLILKGMSSSSPWIYNNTTNKKFSGGGFFLKWNGLGIAIDPGYNFVDCLHKNGLNINDINVIIITHNHIDHNHDLRILDDMNKCLYRHQKHNIDIYLDNETYNASKFFLLDFSTINKINENNKCNIIKYKDETTDVKHFKINDDCFLTIFPTYHIENKKEDEKRQFSASSFGVKLELYQNKILSCTLGYTSDTSYDKLICEQLLGSDIIIANISGVYEDDIKKVNHKKRHLGYYGCYELLKHTDSNLKLFLLSEFWSGNDDIRFDIAKYMQKEYDLEFPNNQVKVHPADIGMKISLKNCCICCSLCGKYSRFSHTIKPSEDFGEIRYICNDCIL